MGQRLSPAWTVLLASAIVVAVSMGAMFSLGVFLKPISESTGWSRGSIATVALLNWVSMGTGSFVWGALSDRFGGRTVALAGGLLLGLGLVVSSQVEALWQLWISFGVLVGFAVGAFYAPLTATTTKWFVERRGLAVALVSSGIGLGVLGSAPVTRALTTEYGWRTAMLVLGDIAWLAIIPLSLLIREPRATEVTAPTDGGAGAGGREFTTRQVVASPQFWAIALTHFACCAAHSGPIFHMVTHASDQGIGLMTAATLLGVSGLSSVAGRIGGGIVADRLGAKPTLIALLAWQAIAVFFYLFATTAPAFFALSIVFGISYGGVMPMYALVTREYFGERVMGSAYGAVFLVSTLGMGLGAWAGGIIYDAVGSYAWLFGGSVAIGVMAVVLAFTFRPPRPFPALVPETASTA